MSYRTGDTATPDGSWTQFALVASSGGALAGNSRYIQYQATLGTTNPAVTPAMTDVTVTYGAVAPPTTFTLSRRRHERRDAGQRDLRLRLRRGHLGLRRGGDDGPRRGLHDRPPGRLLQGLRPDQHPGLPRPVHRRLEPRDRDRHHGQRRHDPGPRPGQPADVHPERRRHERRDAGQRDLRLRLRRGHLGLRRGGDDGPRRGLHDRPPGRLLQGLRPDQHPGLPRPVHRRLEPRDRDRHHGQRRHDPGPRPGQPADVHPERRRHERRDAGQRDLRLRLRRGHLGLRRGGDDGPRRGLHDRPPGRLLQGLRPDQHPGLPRPVHRRLEPRDRDRHHGQRRHDPGPRPGQPADVHPVRRRHERRDAGQRDLRLRLRRGHLGLRRGGDDGPRRGLHDRPPGRLLQGLRPDQHPGLPRPVHRRLEPRDRDRHHGQRRHDPGPRPGQPADVHPVAAPSRAARRRSAGPSSTSSTRPPRPTSGRRRWAPARPTRSTSGPAPTRPTSRPTPRPTPTSTSAARASRPRPSSRSAPTRPRTSPWPARRRSP